MKYFIKRSDEVVKSLIGKKRYFIFPLFILQSLLEIVFLHRNITGLLERIKRAIFILSFVQSDLFVRKDDWHSRPIAGDVLYQSPSW